MSQLNEASQIVSNVFTQNKISARITGGNETSRLINLFLHLDGHTRISQISSLSEELAYHLNSPMVRIYRRLGSVCIEIYKNERTEVNCLDLVRIVTEQYHGCVGILGVDFQDNPLLLRLNSSDVAHLLIAGTTGSGKTELAKAFIASAMIISDARYLIIDPKQTDFELFEDLPALRFPSAKTFEAANRLLDWTIQEMEVRNENRSRHPNLVLLIDELADFMMQGGTDVEEKLTRLLQRGRSAGISVVGITQKPLASVIGSLIKGNFPTRVVGRVMSPEESKVATGLRGQGAELLKGRGDFILVMGGETRRFQASHLYKEDYVYFRNTVK